MQGWATKQQHGHQHLGAEQIALEAEMERNPLKNQAEDDETSQHKHPMAMTVAGQPSTLAVGSVISR